MPHTKHVWVDENVQFPNRYLVDGVYKTITRDVGTVTAQDPISASKLNAIENSLTELIGTYAVNLYVNGTTGNDANDGLSAGTALKTIMAAVNKLPIVVYQNININIADGTYNEAVEVIGRVGSGIITLTGNTTTIGAVKITSANSNRNSCYVTFSGFEATTTAAVGFNSGTDKHTLFDKCKCVTASANAGFLVANGKARFQTCEASNRSTGILVYYGGDATILTCSGTNNSAGVGASVGGIARITDSSPDATSSNSKYVQETGGQIFKPNGVMKWDGLNTSEVLKVGAGTIIGIDNGNLAIDPSITYYAFSSGSNVPASNIEWFVTVQFFGNGNLHQTWRSFNTGVVEEYHRERVSGNWGQFYKVYHNGNYSIVKFITGNYTLTDSDHGKILCTQEGVVTTDITITIPQGLKADFECAFQEKFTGTGKTTIVPASGVGLWINPDHLKRTLNGLCAMAYLKQRNTNTYGLSGNLKV